MKKHHVLSVLALAGLGVGCSTVHVTRVQPGRGGELAVQEGIFGEPAHVKVTRVMQDQCPEGFVIEEEADIKVGSTTVTQAESEGRVSRNKVSSSTATVSETRDKTERRITWKCKGAVTEVAPVSPKTEVLPLTGEAPESGSPAAASIMLEKKPTGWTFDFAMGRRWYKPSDETVAHFHSTNMEFRGLYELLPGLDLGGSIHIDGYDNDTGAAEENFTSSLFEFGLSTKIGPRLGAFRPYIVGNYFLIGSGNREYERSVGFVNEKYVGRNSSRGIDGALGLAWQLGEGSVYFEWYRSAEREMQVKGRLERQVVYPNGMVHTSSEGEKRSFKTHYDGFALGLSFPIKN